MPFNLPPHLQSRLSHLKADVQELLSPLTQNLRGTQNATGFATVQENARKFWEALNPASHRTLGGTFKHLCVVGLNKTELLLGGENAPLTAATWQELTDDTMRNNLGMVFFAPRTLDGTPVNPYLFLTGESETNELDEIETDAMAVAEQQLAGFAMLDFCRIVPAQPNIVNILIAADVLFHWDIKDNYVLPTTPTTWVRDVEQILRSYPRTTKANLYTQWDTEILPPSDRIAVAKLRDLPLDNATWINQPTVQEAYGTHALVLGMVLAGLVGSLLWWQRGTIADLEEDARTIEQQIPREGRFAELNRAIGELEKMIATREIFYLSVKDTANAIEKADTKIANFEVRTPDANDVPTQLIVSIETAKGAYNGWLEEEPVARNLLLNSALMQGIRKPPSTVFRLEGLIELRPLQREYQRLMQGKALQAGKTDYTTAAKAYAAKNADAEADVKAAEAKVSEEQTEEGAQ